MEIYLVRHTAVAVPRGICYGFSDVELAHTKETDISYTLSKLPNFIEKVYASPLSRCRQLADKIGADVHWDERLRELNFGTWEMCKWDEISTEELDPWMADFEHIRTPEGESYADLRNRAMSFWEEVSKQEASHIAIISHGGFIKTLVCALMDIPVSKTFQIRVDYGSVTKLTKAENTLYIDYLNR